MADGRTGEAIVDITQGEITAVTVLVGIVNAKNLSWILLIALIIAGTAVIYILRSKKTTGRMGTAHKQAHIALTQKERTIVDAIAARGGKLTVRELRFVLQLPRTSLLRTLQNLESRGVLVRKEEHGRTLVELLVS
jgi:uncharacterized membrane protein